MSFITDSRNECLISRKVVASSTRTSERGLGMLLQISQSYCIKENVYKDTVFFIVFFKYSM